MSGEEEIFAAVVEAAVVASVRVASCVHRKMARGQRCCQCVFNGGAAIS